MSEHKFEFAYEVYNNIGELTKEDADLLMKARSVTKQAYAPYSNFFVGAAAKLMNGEIVFGTNQENASYPVGICAERVLLGNAATLFPNIAIDTIAISYDSKEVKSDHPISPCGMCRQALLEYETRTHKSIRLILAGQEGEIYVVKTAGYLLPFAFNSSELI
ncbi:cytidine deaminase [Terrimonas pollutisoli]|uniref:cytidine deaminase n=1 Tax=Terrimonas pollutisoli TaxID=3034147 RepID=UPI0023EB3315|nr:cytidine deaminase [Terrimonas sp. H1YJ31]